MNSSNMRIERTFSPLALTITLQLLGCGGGGSQLDDGVGGRAGTGGSSSSTGESVGGSGGGSTEPCPSGGLAAGDHTLTLTHDGVAYDYLVHVPPGLDPTVPVPLVLNWHGLSSNATQQRFFSAMNPVADARKFIVVYPNSPDTSWNAGTCCAVLAPNRDDVGFALALVEKMKQQACIDAKRVYSTGMSNGGYMSHRLACEHADVFAAIAPVAGTLSIPACNPSRPISVIHFHGTADKNVPYYGNATNKPVPQHLQEWADRNGCTPTPTVTFSQADAKCETWNNCQGGVVVRLCTFEGEGHCWPGQSFCPYGASTTTLNASDEAATFFDQFHL